MNLLKSYFLTLLLSIVLIIPSYSLSTKTQSTTINQDIPDTLTLEQAVDYALNNNTDIKTQRQAIEVAKAQYIQARSNILPQLNLTAEGNQLGNAFATSSSGTYGTQLFSTLSLTQPLFTFGRLGSAIKFESLAIQIQETQLLQIQQAIELSVASAYYDVLLQEELVNVNEEALKISEDHLKEAQLRFDQGVNTQFDVTRAKVDVANNRPSLISARNDLIKARQNLNQLFNLPPNTHINLVGKLDFTDYSPNSENSWKIAHDNRPDIKGQMLTVKQGESFLSLNRARYFPFITAGGNYNIQSNSYQGSDQYSFENWSANVTLTMPIFDGFNIMGLVKQAKASLEQEKLAYEKTILSAQTEVEQTILEIKKQKELVDASKEAIDLAELSLKMARLSYENGKATTLDVSDAELSLTTARSNWVKAIHDYLIALATLKKALGVDILPT